MREDDPPILCTIVDSMDQGSPLWHHWRKGGVTATDISILTGSNPYKTPLMLWEIKCGLRGEDPLNPAMMHGIENEPKVREYMNNYLECNCQPVCVEGKKSHYRASLDGYDRYKKILIEIKCPRSDKILDDARDFHKVPPYWIDQIRWQISIVEPNEAYFAVFDYRSDSYYVIVADFLDMDFTQIQLLADDFWFKIQCGHAPEPLAKDYIVLDDPELLKKLREYESINRDVKALTAKKNTLKSEIESYGDDGNFMIDQYKIVRVPPRISYDIEKMKNDGIILDKYVKKSDSIGYYRIILPKS